MVVRRIVSINAELCNGCGSCIPKCAEGALQIVNGKAKIVKEVYCDGLGACLGHCPQGAISIEEREAAAFDQEAVHDHLVVGKVEKDKKPSIPQWPLKLNLIPLVAPFYENAELLIAADCATVAYPNLRQLLLPGKRIVIGCPKFDDAGVYAQKLGEILKRNKVASITVAHMEVPCCSGLKWAVDKAVQVAGKSIPVKRYVITIGGEITEL